MMVYIVIGVYQEDEYICGVYGNEDAANDMAGYYTESHSLAGFTYEVRAYEVHQ